MGFWGRGEDIWWGSPRTECLRREGFSPLCTVYSLKPIVTQWCVWGLMGDVIISCTISAQSVQGLGSYGTPNFPISYSSSSLYWQKCNRAERTKKEEKKHCCQIAKIQQTHIKVQSHRITNHQAKFKLTQENKWNDSFNHTSTKSNDILYDKLHRLQHNQKTAVYSVYIAIMTLTTARSAWHVLGSSVRYQTRHDSGILKTN